MRRCFSIAIFACLAIASWPAWSGPEVEVKRNHGIFSVHATAPVAADVETAWQVLTDYNHLAEFVPDMKSSHVVSVAGEPLHVEQKGETGFLFFNRDFEVVLEVEEMPPKRLKFRATGGDMKHMQGEWRIRADADSVNIEYEAEIEPDFWVPPLVGTALMRRDIRGNIEGVIREMLRRYAAARGKTAARLQ